ncbi:WD40 repeat domain-containing protein [Polymorphum gilvum]|uniref:WD-repeat family protein n=1 Tax=Polymorphum gilvum (strain LMG 25793 / CGMCC 1.9160 / SL003B-26A1) TaxID=991905 RepID=F2IWE1_POLGS|nr:WD40 repeat domain-containing protein [Polymorphum gilvum]ADZ69240.1 WD-repeat family protein [Polymorphum gilvum SL003B-26A1]
MTTVVPVDVAGFVVRAGFLNDTPYFALGEGSVVLATGGEMRLAAHKGGLLAAEERPDGSGLVTGGDDGLIRQVTADGRVTTLAERPRKWIDLVACGPSGTVAFASGRTAWVRLADGTEKEFSHERAVGGLAFAPKGLRLAVARYDGATLWWVNTLGKPQQLEWKGAHLAITFSPDGKYLVTAMQENALHGWRLKDGQDMRMTGYPAKVKSWSWSAKGRYLMTSGANAAIAWPFFGKTGPMGQNPLQLGSRGDALVTAVACHPKEEVAAVGYQDGMVLICRFEDNAEVLLRRPGKAPVSSLAWDRGGERLVFGSEAGEAGIISLR